MNYEAAIMYAHQRMREIGKTIDQYHFEPVSISATQAEQLKGQILIHAFNEVYIIVHTERYFGLTIIADNSTYDSDEARQSGAPEFTGLIRILRTGTTWSLQPVPGPDRPIPLEFLRVVIY